MTPRSRTASSGNTSTSPTHNDIMFFCQHLWWSKPNELRLFGIQSQMTSTWRRGIRKKLHKRLCRGKKRQDKTVKGIVSVNSCNAGMQPDILLNSTCQSLILKCHSARVRVTRRSVTKWQLPRVWAITIGDDWWTLTDDAWRPCPETDVTNEFKMTCIVD